MLSILMPVFNERERVERAISAVLGTELPTDFELIVVDDGSTDGTGEILHAGGGGEGRVRLIEHPENGGEGGGGGGGRLIEHPENRGKGAAVRTALAQARGEFSAIFDADLEYEPGDL